jgi:2-polyprenyl-3-methyl-5-hydroxy-6-metoxy-1,4-benzoquinol methylase
MIQIKNCPVCGATNFSEYLDLKDFFLTGESFQLQKCDSCQFVFTNPRPDDKSLSKYYESPDYLSHHSHGMNPVQLVYQELRRINIRNKFSLIKKLVPNGRLLDIGCGTGEVLNYFKKKKWEVKGIEPSRSARDFAIQKYGLDIEDESGLKKLQKDSFDIISMWHVLEHVSDLHERIHIIYDLLKPSGYLIIALPNLNSWDAEYYKKYWAAFDVPRHLSHFSERTLKKLVIGHGFKYVETAPMKMDAYFISMLSEKYLGKHNRFLYSAINGFRSNKSAKKSGEYSSLIYIFQK